MKVLFVCSRNRRRSLTAEKIFSGVPGWQVRSAGTAEGARVKVTEGLLGWADVLVVMEKRHKERLQEKFPESFDSTRCRCLFIADKYDFMEESLGAPVAALIPFDSKRALAILSPLVELWRS